MSSTGDKGYLTADGQIVQYDAADRGEPVSLSGEDLDGEPLELEAFRGKPVVVVVWGSWCAPCRAEAPDVVGAAEDLGERAQFVGVNIRDTSTAQAKSFVRTFEVPYPSFYSPDGKALLPLGSLPPNAIPSFVVLDAEGRVAATIIGKLPSRTTLVEVTEDVVTEASETGDG